MHVRSVGGGPGGLLLGILLRQADPSIRVTVHERNRPDDTFGFGVVFSDETLANVTAVEPELVARIEAEFRSWTDMDLVFRDQVVETTGHGFAALSRVRLLQILTERAVELGVDVRFGEEIDDPRQLADHDLLVGSDGLNSVVRNTWRERFDPTVELGEAKFIWCGTHKLFDRFTFIFEETEHGLVTAHVYPYDDTTSTVIVEMHVDTWRRAGLDATEGMYAEPGQSDEEALRYGEKVLAAHLDGHPLLGNNSKWLQFPTVSNEHWWFDNVALVGDAVHTAHFSIGSGTKLALEDAISLAEAVLAESDLATALDRYEAERKPVAASLQRAARTSQEWFEHVDRRWNMPAPQFAFSLLTRSMRITHDNLTVRDPAFVGDVRHWWWRTRPEAIRPADPDTPPLFHPFRLRDLELANRIVVSPMAQYCAVDGNPTDWHLIHLGSRAVGGAGLVMTEMVCVSPTGRITPGCAGIWDEAQQALWARSVEFAHEYTNAKMGLQIGHSGRKGSTKVPWEGIDRPLDDGNWPLLAPSALPYGPDNAVPAAMTRADMDEVRDQFVHSARLGAEAGFDLLELHAAHGYLLSGFLSPVTNQRDDDYGGSPERRLRYPLEVLDAVRAVWPNERPLSVRISATDWIEDGFTGDDAVELASVLAEHGVDIVDVSTGQVDPAEEPRFGRLYQTPFSERIRNEAGVPTMTVGAVASIDDINTILVAGRADLCVMARPHLVDPYWTLNAAIDLGYDEHQWPVQYLSGQTARRREQLPTSAVERDAR